MAAAVITVIDSKEPLFSFKLRGAFIVRAVFLFTDEVYCSRKFGKTEPRETVCEKYFDKRAGIMSTTGDGI